MSTNQQTIESYEKGVEDYVSKMVVEVSDPFKSWFDAFLSELPTGTEIFEIGSGPGRDASYFESKGYEVVRSDATREFVEHMRADGKDARQFNVLLDEFDRKYDAIFADAVFLHFNPDEIELALAKVYEALKSGGLFAFSLKEGVGQHTENEKLNNIRYFCYWEENDIHDILKEIGFDRIKINVKSDTRPNKPAWLMITAGKK